MNEAFSLAGRVAIVTGAGSGIGRATAVVLAGAGAGVVLADIDQVGLDATAGLIGDGGSVVATDVSRSDEVDALVAGVLADAGRLDVFANVAGIIVNRSIVETSDDELDRVLGVNLRGPFYGCRAALRAMTSAGNGGSIVNVVSAAIDQPSPGLVAYSMSKAAVNILTRVAAREGGTAGVRVNAVAPGFVRTPMTERHATLADGSLDASRMQAVLDRMKAGSPLGLTGEPDDVAYAVLYLASDAARFVTGTTLRVNGGVAMPW